MDSITAGAVPNYLSQDLSPTLLGEGEAFQDEDGRPFTNGKTITLSIKRTGG